MKILLFLFIPLFLFAQSEYNPRGAELFTTTDTLLGADTLTSGWQNIGVKVGSQTLGFLFDPIGDASVDVSGIELDAQVGMSGFTSAAGGAFDDSIAAGTNTGWMHLATIDSAAIADSVAWYYPLSSEDWWHWIDYIRFRLRNATAADSFMVTKARRRGQ